RGRGPKGGPGEAPGEAPGEQTDAQAQWILSRGNAASRLEKIKKLLNRAAAAALTKKGIGEEHHDLYRRLVPTAAWQESCFRQFKRKKGEVVYLRSYNNSSVGIMQINERVWRGMYAPDHLRWDISYNMRAGCEILHLYFHKYLLRKMRKLNMEIPDEETMAGIMYAMYNGGPGQFSKYLKRKKQGKYYLSDTLFMEKFTWVTNGQWMKIKKCL
ncbi:MAG: lytic transglycosylase domain-containing protein, partial [Desulfobacterales bacterium]|nr:lytic transglycosylase domain-containing protein [Desulfobacterales bacterium]